MPKFDYNSRPAIVTRWIVTHPIISILLTLLSCSVFLSGLGNFHISNSARVYQGDTPLTRRLVELEETYSEDKNLNIIFTTSENTIFKPETLSAIKAFTEGAWGLPYVRRVDSITNFQYSYAEGDNLIVRDLVETPESLSDEDVGHLERAALSEPRLVGYLLSDDASATAININFSVELDDIAALQEIDGEIDLLIQDAVAANPHLTPYKSGYVGATLGWFKAIDRDVRVLYSSTVAIIFVGLCLFFRSIGLGVATLLLAVLAAACAGGSTGFFGFVIGSPTAVGFLMIFMLALADSIHVVKIARLLVAQGKDKDDAIVESVCFNLRPIVITSVTTAIGFLSFLFSDYTGTRVFGGYVAFGVLLACILSLSLLPALMTFCAIRPKGGESIELSSNLLADFIIRHRWFPIIAVVPMAIASVYFLRQSDINDNPIHYMQEWTDFRQGLFVVEDRLTGTMEVMLELSSGEEQGVSDPEFMAQVDAFAQWLRGQENVRFVNVYTDTMKRLNQNLNMGMTDHYALPTDRALAAQYLLLYELSLPYGLDLTNQINMDKSATRLVAVINDTPSVELLAFKQEISDWLDANAPAVTGSEPTGSILLITITAIDTFISMMYGSVTALLVIGVILLFTFRAFYPGLLSMIMIFAPLLVSFGAWSLMRGLFDMSTAFALCMAIGIVVDNAVHFISKFQHASRDLGYGREDAIRYTFNTVSSAIVTNALVLCAGFGILYFSDFKSNATMGVLTSLSLGTALIGTFTLLPALLMFRKDKAE